MLPVEAPYSGWKYTERCRATMSFRQLPHLAACGQIHRDVNPNAVPCYLCCCFFFRSQCKKTIAGAGSDWSYSQGKKTMLQIMLIKE